MPWGISHNSKEHEYLTRTPEYLKLAENLKQFIRETTISERRKENIFM